MPGGNHQGRQSMMLDANQELPQHNAWLSVRMYREISNTPEHISFVSHHQVACWTLIKATLHAKCLTYKVPLLARYIKHTPYGQPPTIGLPEHNDNMNDQPVPNLQDVRGQMNQQYTSWQRSISRQCHDARRSTYKNMISKLITLFFQVQCHAQCRSGLLELLEHNDEHYTTYNTSAFNQNCVMTWQNS